MKLQTTRMGLLCGIALLMSTALAAGAGKPTHTKHPAHHMATHHVVVKSKTVVTTGHHTVAAKKVTTVTKSKPAAMTRVATLNISGMT